MADSPLDPSSTENCVAIIGGSGLYELESFEPVREHVLDTPFGSPSDTIVEAKIGSTRALFLPRHGRGHHLLPSEVNYRANIYALKVLGAKWCIGVQAVGSFREDLKPGDFLVPNQVIDHTRRRESTFFGNGITAYVSLADPFCPALRQVVVDCLLNETKCPISDNASIHSEGTYLCMEGPALSTRAESHLYRSWNADIIGMTVLPECKLAREAEISYTSLCMITDYDCWRSADEAAQASDILALLKSSTSTVKAVLPHIIHELETKEPSKLAADALAPALVTDLSSLSEQLKIDLKPIIGRYL